jgi:hypothetical protein
MSCLIFPQLSIRLLPILPKLSINNPTRNFDIETATFANRKLWIASRLAALLYILRRKRHLSIQRKKLYLRMSSVLLNTSILAIYGLWKSSEIVLLTNRSQYVLLTNHSHYVCPCICNAAIRIKIPSFDSAWEIVLTDFKCITKHQYSSVMAFENQAKLYCWQIAQNY